MPSKEHDHPCIKAAQTALTKAMDEIETAEKNVSMFITKKHQTQESRQKIDEVLNGLSAIHSEMAGLLGFFT